jgi:hypothetical protein
MSTVFSDISHALDAHLGVMAALPPVAWQNVSYAPVSGVLYLRPTLLPAPTRQAGLGDAGLDEYQGVYQVDVFAAVGGGREVAEAQADVIGDHFKRGTSLVRGTTSLRLRDVSRTAGTIDGDRFAISISINYLAYLPPR